MVAMASPLYGAAVGVRDLSPLPPIRGPSSLKSAAGDGMYMSAGPVADTTIALHGGGSIVFPRHGAASWIVGPTLPTPGPAGLFSVANSVSADSRGRFLAVGGEQAGGGNESIALMWRGNTVSNLNDLVDPALGWHFLDAAAINLHGDIVGTGSFRGTYSAFILTPNSKS